MWFSKPSPNARRLPELIGTERLDTETVSQRNLFSVTAGLRMPRWIELGETRHQRRGASSIFAATTPPRRPAAWLERLANGLFLALSPRVSRARQPLPSIHLEPYERFEIERWRTGETLSATWYPAFGTPRGAVLLAHPWIKWGQSYFHRRGRIGALRAAGYHVMTFDLAGLGSSSKTRSGFFDRDLEDALAALGERAAGLPVHLWGVSCGGYWAHLALSRVAVSGAMFEDVSPHFIEWSGRMAPWGWPCYTFFRLGFRSAYRFMDLRRHAPLLRVRAASYVSGALDGGVLPGETQELARLAGGRYLIVDGADHLEAIKRDGEGVIALALSTFELAERSTRRAGKTNAA